MAGVAETKKAWRRLAADMFRLVDRGTLRACDAALCDRVWEYAAGCGAGLLLAYAPMADEPDLWPFLRRWGRQGGRLALPVWSGGCGMALKEVRDCERQLRPGRCGILEPTADCAGIDPREADLCLVPGRLFSEARERLGRGAGCYDRLLAGGVARTLGVAYDFQVFPQLPVDDGDQPVDALLTPTRLLDDVAAK